jgi:hypothetical protein
MGLYRRQWRKEDGKLVTSSPWWMSAIVDGRQVCKPTGVTNKELHKRFVTRGKLK